MFAVKRHAVIGFNLYCGGGGAPGLAAASPPAPAGSGPAPPASAAAEGAWAAGGRAEVPRALIGPQGAPRALIGGGAAPRALIGAAPRPASLWSPEQELDGCEPEAERGGGGAAGGGGSLPGTPPAPEHGPDELRQDSLELISRYLREAAGEAQPGAKKLFPGLLGGPGRPGAAGDGVMEKALETLRRVGDGVLQKHELAFQGMLRKLDIQKEEDLQSVCEVAAHVFSDGVTNWGRVVTLISFGAFVAKHLKSINQEKCISSLAGIITDALVSSKREWLVSQGGWEGFVDFFRVEDLEGSIRNVLMAFAGVAGLGASLAYMIR
ncbi:induced myeloid leukemia cell differentiation protein Mcl-1 [Dromaius novaehollandiae]|uniref:induced myeloid leukemia cell differentiation protein Mcl-1 n=1 Tax=Dromaius novaehollandiae TaxID=8790 RepID=UPI00311D6F41